MLMLCPSEMIREPAAEMLGTMILTLLGCGGNCQAVLSQNTGVASSPKGGPVSASLGWACGQSLAMLCSITPDKGH
jgi:aquaglyceroporin related protein